jgi:hypothetical protein
MKIETTERYVSDDGVSHATIDAATRADVMTWALGYSVDGRLTVKALVALAVEHKADFIKVLSPDTIAFTAPGEGVEPSFVHTDAEEDAA